LSDLFRINYKIIVNVTLLAFYEQASSRTAWLKALYKDMSL